MKVGQCGRAGVGNVKDWAGGVDGLKNRSGKCEGPVGGLDRLKNWSGKCEGPGRGGPRGKEPEWEMRRIGVMGGDQRLFEITHMCIMHGVHTSPYNNPFNHSYFLQ